MSVRARERAPLRRDAAPVQGERAAQPPSSRSSTACRRRSRPSSTSRASTTRSATRSARSSTTRTWASASTTRRRDLDPLSVRLRGRQAHRRSRPDRCRSRDSPRIVLRTRETLVINENMAAGDRRSTAASRLPGTQMEKSAVYVPMVAGDQARGLISSRSTWSASTRSAIPTCACCRRSPTA